MENFLSPQTSAAKLFVRDGIIVFISLSAACHLLNMEFGFISVLW